MNNYFTFSLTRNWLHSAHR